MSTPINNFQDILDAMEQAPALRDALRRHILTEELMQMAVQLPARLDRIKGDIGALQEGQSRIEEKVDRIGEDVSSLAEGQASLAREVARIGGDVSMLTGDGYESYAAAYADRYLRRGPGINARVISTQRDQSALKGMLDQAEIHGVIEPGGTDDADQTDLVLTSDGPTDYILAEVSVTIRQRDIDMADRRARVLAKATGRSAAPFVIVAREEPGLHRGEVQVVIIPERQDP